MVEPSGGGQKKIKKGVDRIGDCSTMNVLEELSVGDSRMLACSNGWNSVLNRISKLGQEQLDDPRSKGLELELLIICRTQGCSFCRV